MAHLPWLRGGFIGFPLCAFSAKARWLPCRTSRGVTRQNCGHFIRSKLFATVRRHYIPPHPIPSSCLFHLFRHRQRRDAINTHHLLHAHPHRYECMYVYVYVYVIVYYLTDCVFCLDVVFLKQNCVNYSRHGKVMHYFLPPLPLPLLLLLLLLFLHW